MFWVLGVCLLLGLLMVAFVIICCLSLAVIKLTDYLFDHI